LPGANPDSYRKGKWRCGLSGLLLLIVWGILPGRIWPQTQEKPQDSGLTNWELLLSSPLAVSVLAAAGLLNRGAPHALLTLGLPSIGNRLTGLPPVML
jgi:hypothetical protein